MKRISTIIFAAALLFGLAQCKKQETPETPNADGKWVHITMKVGSGDRYNIYPNTGAVVYTDGDKIYVGNGNVYRGTLTYADGTFSGDLYYDDTHPMDNNDYLHFYFVGGLETGTLTPKETTSFTVDISNQSSQLPVLSYGHSTQKYTDGTATYSCMLENKCGLVKFVPSVATSLPITVSGMKTTASIDFSTGSITPTEATGGITLNSESNAVKWAVLLEQSEVANPTVTISGFEAAITSVPTITNNYYNNSGVGISMMSIYPGGAIDGLFTINSNNDKVYFSQGNLQYKNGTGWRFAEHQWDYINAWNTSDWVDRFRWGTWTKDKNPLQTSGSFSWSEEDFSGTLSNASNSENWFTLSIEEWLYIFNSRETGATINNTEHARYTESTINTDGTAVNGIIFFPDDYSGGTPSGVTWGTINGGSNWATKCTSEGWTALEAAGCVFMPAAGHLYEYQFVNVGTDGIYWSKTTNTSSFAYRIGFHTNGLDLPVTNAHNLGFSVRLVCPAVNR